MMAFFDEDDDDDEDDSEICGGKRYVTIIKNYFNFFLSHFCDISI